ncbi:HigA family addiction module antitoxin [Zavarzinia compransoris]|uniref:Addiction module antidote protein, HigA family n=1 Tax=Zavarzinia compransoris TaxID=1264899 RepID=A0A317E0F2_9PROT|nr:HigA family addiction module antitoxin [Zavarzinia compransoris]PWR19580.1 addiction module antidote protein, HigA family [Zavarzinia compransoris]TDP40436.1 addiction module HigA family antidote [Zavarzinia compransoris]
MTEDAVQRPDRAPTHPGAALEDILLDLDTPKAEIARMAGISRQHLYDLLACRKPVSPEIAVRLGKLLGGGGGPWIRMQAAYDLWQAERNVDTSAIPTIRAA